MPLAPSAETRFRPFLRLEAGPLQKTPVIMKGTLHAWRLLEGLEGERLRWYERMLPNKFRVAFAAQAGLEDYAVNYAEDLPKKKRSAAWLRLLDWHRRYPELPLERKVALLMLNNKLCLNLDNERLLAGDAPSRRRRWSEADAHYAYQRAFSPYMVRESLLRSPPSALARVFHKAPAGTRVQFMSANKFIVLSFELKRVTALAQRARRVCWQAVEAFRKSFSPCEAKVWESKYWRADTYFPDQAGDEKGLRRSMDRAQAAARQAVALAEKDSAADPFLAHFAEENAHAVAATLGIIHMHHKRWKEALAQFTWMAGEDPLGYWQRLARGRMLLELERPEEAYAELKAGLALAVVGREAAYGWLARCCEKLGRPEEARSFQAAARREQGLVEEAGARRRLRP